MRELVIASPGSGKTSYISASISRMVGEGVPADEIYAVTFTREAAKEMKSKIRDDLVSISTIHSLAWSIVRHSKSVDEDPPADTFYYQIITGATELVRAGYELPMSMLAIDEAQDLSKDQYEFLLELSKRATHLLVVGDPLQSIFSFQRSDPKYMRMFKDVYEDMEEKPLMSSYRLPSSVVRYVKKIFPEAQVEPARQGGEVEVVETNSQGINPSVKGRLIDRAGTTAVLFRTNAEIVRFVRSVLNKQDYNYVVPLSEHPLVAATSVIMTLNEDIEPQLFMTTAEFLGYGGWEAKVNLQAILTLYLKGERLTYDKLASLYGRGDLYMKGDAPLLTSRAKVAMRSLLDTIKYLSPEVEGRSVTELEVIEAIRKAGYNIDEMWSVPDEELVKAVKRKMYSHSETYYRVDNGAPITVSTIHAAKGKEYDNVVTVVNHVNYGAAATDEEMRVLYVALTRARDTLTIVIPVKDLDGKAREQFTVMDAVARTVGII